MASRALPYVLLLLLLLRLDKDIVVSATTTVLFYTDASCKTPHATVQTDTDAGNGQCGIFPTAINSASSIAIDYGCSVTTYTGSSDQGCSYDATLVAVGNCTVMNIGSFSVDCPEINGTNAPDYTTILASDAGTRTSRPSTASTSTSPLAVSPGSSLQQKSSATGNPSSDPSSPTTSTTGLPSPPQSSPTTSTTSASTPAAPSSTALSTPDTPTSPSRGTGTPSSPTVQSSPTPSPSPSGSQGESETGSGSGNGNDGGLSGPSTIAIGVVLPGVAVVVAVVFGVLGVKKWKRRNRSDVRPGRRRTI